MKHFFALLLSVLMVLSLLTACGDKTTPSDGDDQTVTDENGGDTDNNTDDTTDPYDAVRNYWSEDPVSYTHLDVYKRQDDKRVRKNTSRSANVRAYGACAAAERKK